MIIHLSSLHGHKSRDAHISQKLMQFVNFCCFHICPKYHIVINISKTLSVSTILEFFFMDVSPTSLVVCNLALFSKEVDVLNLSKVEMMLFFHCVLRFLCNFSYTMLNYNWQVLFSALWSVTGKWSWTQVNSPSKLLCPNYCKFSYWGTAHSCIQPLFRNSTLCTV